MKPDRLLDLFCELARIESPSRREALMAKRCKAELEGLGFTVRFDDSAERTGSDTGNLIAFRAGSVSGAVALCGHMDTVRPCKGIEPVVEGGVIRSAGDTILSADDKAGVAAIFEGVRSLIEAGEELPDVHIVLTTCEEMHLLGAGALDASFLSEGTPCYVLDADGDPGTIINQAPCHCTFTATCACRRRARARRLGACHGGAGGLPYALGAHFRAYHVQCRRHRVRRGHERGARHLLAVG